MNKEQNKSKEKIKKILSNIIKLYDFIIVYNFYLFYQKIIKKKTLQKTHNFLFSNYFFLNLNKI